MMKTLTVTIETFKKHFLSRSFLLMIFIPILLALIAIPIWGGGSKRIDIVSNNQQLTKAIRNTSDTLFTSKNQTLRSAKKRLNDGDTKAYIKIDDSVTNKEGLKAKIYGANISADQLSQVRQVFESVQLKINYASADITKDQSQSLNVKPSVQYKSNQSSVSDKTFYVGLTTGLIIYLIIMVYSSMFAQEIGSEKGNKVMEMILSSISATQYFFGKLFGMVLLLITNLVIYSVFFGVLVLFKHQLQAINTIIEYVKNLVNGNVTSIILLDGIFILFGVALFLLISSFVGIGVTKQEDISKAAMPVGLIVMVLYMSSLWTLTLATPINSVTKVLSVLPFTSSFFLPIWVSTGSVPTWVISGAIILAVVSIILLSWVFSQLYKTLALYKGNNPIKYSLKNFLKH